MERSVQLTRTQRVLVGIVAGGALIIAGIGFAGSYTAVSALARREGFGAFSLVLPIGVDAGIVVLLALDLLLTWLRIPYPLLRQAAWLLTAGTVVFNAAASWGNALAMGMHAIIPVLFITVVEAARHATGRVADLTADRHIEPVRVGRWILAPPSTFRLWRRMKLWELRSYQDALRHEQDRLVYRAHLRARYGRRWRTRAPVREVLPLRLSRLGVPVPPAPADPHNPTAPDSAAPPALPPTAGNHGTSPAPRPPGGDRPRRSPARQRQPRSPQSAPAAPTGAAKPPATQPATGTPPPATSATAGPAPATAPADDAHRAAITAAASHADAIRYALRHNPGLDDQGIIAWLKDRGREVNRGQVYRVRERAEQRSNHQAAAAQTEPPGAAATT